jgi:hypothetical protein
MSKLPLLKLTLVPLACLSFVGSAFANDYGEVGIIDIPTARFSTDAVLSTTVAFDQAHDSYAITYQALPWLEAAFRYSGSFKTVTDRRVYWDRNYSVKARVLEESQYLPQLAVGVRDLIGTGVFASEYVVGSKQIRDFDLTLGMGWGRLAGDGLFSNPFNALDTQFDFRPPRGSGAGQGGTLRNYYFRGDAGLFGGVAYQITNDVRLLAEFNPDQYDFTRKLGPSQSIQPSSPFSVGVDWQVLDDLRLSVSFQHMDQIGFSFSSSLDTAAIPEKREVPDFISSRYLPASQLPSQIDKNKWYDRLLYDVERSGLLLVEGTISNDGKSAELVVGNADYALWSDALGQHIALADLHLPATVETLYMIAEDGGHRAATVIVPRPSFNGSQRDVIARSRVVSGRTLYQPDSKTGFATGQVVSSVGLNQRLQLFDPDDPARYQVYASIGSEYVLNNHWSVRAQMAVDLENNFGDSRRRRSDSELPNVRTGIVNYLIEGATGLESLIVEGRDSYGSNWHYRAFGGVLEQMYSGVGGEVLYWKSRSRVALGMSLAYVKQRGFKRDFELLDYEVMTGFVSAYWATPWYNYDVAVHAGRYLAKDVGGTVELRRTFRNGWQVGVFTSLTDVPFDVFGEGSFDKGFYFQVPLGALFGGSDRNKFGTRIRPVLRDGGQRLEDLSGNIFWDLREARYDALVIDERMLP